MAAEFRRHARASGNDPQPVTFSGQAPAKCAKQGRKALAAYWQIRLRPRIHWRILTLGSCLTLWFRWSSVAEAHPMRDRGVYYCNTPEFLGSFRGSAFTNVTAGRGRNGIRMGHAGLSQTGD